MKEYASVCFPKRAELSEGNIDVEGRAAKLKKKMLSKCKLLYAGIKQP